MLGIDGAGAFSCQGRRSAIRKGRRVDQARKDRFREPAGSHGNGMGIAKQVRIFEDRDRRGVFGPAGFKRSAVRGRIFRGRGTLFLEGWKSGFCRLPDRRKKPQTGMPCHGHFRFKGVQASGFSSAVSGYFFSASMNLSRTMFRSDSGASTSASGPFHDEFARVGKGDFQKIAV